MAYTIIYAGHPRSLPVLSVTRLMSVGILYYCYYDAHYVIQWESCRWTERARCSDAGRGVWRVHSGEARWRHCLTAPPRWHTGYTITIHKCTHIYKYIYIISYLFRTLQCAIVSASPARGFGAFQPLHQCRSRVCKTSCKLGEIRVSQWRD